MRKLLKLSLSLIVLVLLFMAAKPRPVHIFMAGDSTMADKVLVKEVFDSVAGVKVQENFLERGWGQLLPEFINDKAIVKNMAQNGKSTKSFVEQGLWTQIVDKLQKGDFVILQFGHNDSSLSKGERYTNPVQFRLNFTAFIQEVKAKGAIPVLCTPVARRKFDKDSVLVPTHGVYPDIIRKVAETYKVTMVDMEKLTSHWLKSEGVEKSNQYFHKFPPGVSKLYPKGLDDNTHFNEAGARIVARLFVEGIKAQKSCKLNQYFIKQ